MANNKPQDETRTSIDEVNDTLTGIGEKVQNNPKVLIWSCIGVAVVVAAILIYVYAIRQPGQVSGNKALGQADIELLMGNDSIALAKYQQVADEHGYDAGNLANLNAAILLYKDKKYEEALGYLKQAVKVSDNNPHYTPAFLMKEATVYREMKDYSAEAAIYEQIIKDYPTYGAEINVDLQKYLDRAKTAAAK